MASYFSFSWCDDPDFTTGGATENQIKLNVRLRAVTCPGVLQWTRSKVTSSIPGAAGSVWTVSSSAWPSVPPFSPPPGYEVQGRRRPEGLQGRRFVTPDVCVYTV